MVRPTDLNHGLELQCCLRVREEVVVEVLDLEQARLTRCDSLSFAVVFGDLALWRLGLGQTTANHNQAGARPMS